MKKKYLFLMRTGEFGGAERYQIDYFKYIDFDKHAVTFAVNVDVFSHHFQRHQLPVELIDIPIPSEKESLFRKFWIFFRFLRKIKPDCVVFNQFWMSTFLLPEVIAAYLVTKGNAYMVVHDCPPASSWGKIKFLKILQGYFTKKTIAVSLATKKSLIEGYSFPKNNVKLIYHGTDVVSNVPSQENKIKLRNKYGIKESDQVVISTAMLHPGKRIDRLLRAFARLAQEKKDIHLIIVGAGAEQKNLLEIAESFQKDIRERIRFLGFQEEVTPLLQLSDIFILPSDSEGLPLSCLEAMSCGLISIVTNCGGPREIILDGYNGFLVEKSEEGVLDALKKTLNLSPDEKKQMSLNARQFVEDKFNIQQNIRQGLQLLEI